MKSLNFNELNKIVGGDVLGTPGGDIERIRLPETANPQAANNPSAVDHTIGLRADRATVIFQ